MGQAKSSSNHQDVVVDEGKATLKVLIVDDSEVIRKQMIGILQWLGTQCLAAEDGEQGLKVLYDNPDVAIIFSDVNMPKMDGLTFVERVHKHTTEGSLKRIPIIMLTTDSAAEQVLRGRKAGVVGWLIKPPSEETIRKVVMKFREAK